MANKPTLIAQTKIFTITVANMMLPSKDTLLVMPPTLFFCEPFIGNLEKKLRKKSRLEKINPPPRHNPSTGKMSKIAIFQIYSQDEYSFEC